MKTIFTFTILLFSGTIFSQSILSGKVVDEKGNPISGANIFIEGTYDGTSSSETGDFIFTTTTKGNQILIVSALTFETSKMVSDVADFKAKTIKLKESANTLNEVVITAGSFDSGFKSKVSVLKPLDVYTTAGGMANIVAAFKTLPGTQNVGEDGRLFVRGGEADEAQTYIDGVRVVQPYGVSAQNVPTRQRFSPSLFSGMSFSSGGYSAEYGEALSSVLLLNTIDEAETNFSKISIMSLGLGLSNSQKWKNSSLAFDASYINLAPYQAIVKQNLDWNKAPQSITGESVYRYHFVNGIFKLYASFSASQLDINQEDINKPEKIRVDLKNNNFYLNSSFKGNFGSNWQIATGLSYGLSQNKIGLNLDLVNNDENALHFKIKLRKSISNTFKLSFGGDYFITDFKEDFNTNSDSIFFNGYNKSIAAVFAESDILFSNKFVARIGLRIANNSLLNENTLSPRISFAYKVAKNSSFSLAYGDFSQTPNANYIKYTKFYQFESEKAQHYILNFQFSKNGQTFRAETYYKGYSNLVKYNTPIVQYNSVFSNNGSGYAKGLELFWRDEKSIKNLEYWVSYSYIDTKRNYKNYPIQVTPSFIANHSLSINAKYFIGSLKSLVGLSNAFTTGRPYNNPNELQFMNGKTKNYNNFSLDWSYLLTTQKIIYFTVSNVLGSQNVYGYNYKNTSNSRGIFDRKEIIPSADRMVFVGFFWTISQDKKKNQLNDL